MKKWFVAFVLLLGINSFFFSYNGVFAETNSLQIVKTKWFDIIYPSECEQTASILVQNADSLCEELYKEFCFEPYFRMPVVITSGNEDFNAYWTSYPYNHIVIYDTAINSELAVFSETVLSTFKHELTHSVTYNLKNPFFKTIGKIFGDAASPSAFLVTSGMAEGATVSMESKNGEGRLNDEFSMQNVKQAKIQNKFPDYFDVQTATDIYPFGQFYYFNGAFNAWLQEKYGMEKYAKLWYTCVNLGAISVKSAYKKIYGISLKTLWQSFVSEYQIPQNIKPDPVVAKQASDIFESKFTNESGRVFSSISANENGLFYLDSVTHSVFYIPWSDVENKSNCANPKKIFTKNNLQSIRCSAEGKYLIYEYYLTSKANIRKSVGIYDIENNSFFDTGITGIEDGFIIKKDDSFYFGCQTFVSQNYGISLYKIENNPKNGKITELTKLWSKYFDFEVMPFSFAPFTNNSGDFAFICKNNKDFTILVWDILGNQKQNFGAPEEGMVFRYLSPVISNKSQFSFSYTKKGCLPRSGIISFENKKITLLEEDISGGIYSPVIFEGEKELTTVYVSHLYNQTKMLKLIGNHNYLEYEAKNVSLPKISDEKSETYQNQQALSGREYKFSDGSFKGLFIPFTSMISRSYDSVTNDEPISLGITYITSNPWDSNLFMYQVGYSTKLKSFAFQFDYSDGTETSLFSYELSNFWEFNGMGLKQVYGSINTSSALPMGNISYFVIAANQFDYFGHGGTVEENNFDFFYNGSAVSAGIRSIYKAGPGRYEKAGFSFDTIFSYQYLNLIDNEISVKPVSFCDLGFKAKLFIPHLIPIECNRNFVYNFPLVITTGIFPGNKDSLNSSGNIYFGGQKLSEIFSYNAMDVEAEVVLFGYEIQKSLPFFSVFYFGEFKIALCYYGGFSYLPEDAFESMHIKNLPRYLKWVGCGELEWENHYALSFQLAMTPVILNVGKITFTSNIIPDFKNNDCYFSLGFSLNPM